MPTIATTATTSLNTPVAAGPHVETETATHIKPAEPLLSTISFTNHHTCIADAVTVRHGGYRLPTVNLKSIGSVESVTVALSFDLLSSL